MSFPESKRIIYDKNPLQQVICQLKFPPILKINTELPVAFQERIKQDYPFFQEKSEVNLVSQGILEQLPKEVSEGLLRGNVPRAYEFVSSDRQWTVSLTRDFLALTTNEYLEWNDFKNRLDILLEVLEDVYAPTFYSRIGLRYQNIIRRSTLNLENTEWSGLLEPHLIGELASPELGKSVIEIFQQVLFRLEEYDSRVGVQHGLVIAQDGTNEPCYLIDDDFFTEQRTELKDAKRVLTYFNRENGNFFRSIITNRLKAALGERKR